MEKYCRQCGTALAEGAKFCRQCGAATGAVESPVTQESAQPTTSLEPTQLMTETLNETTPLAQIQRQTRPRYSQRHLALIGGAIVLIAVVAVSFYLGRWSRNQSTEPTGPQPPLSSDQASAPSPAPPTPAKKPTGDAADQPATKSAKTAERAKQHLDQGNDYLNTGRYREALQEYEQVRRLDKSNYDVYYLMGIAYEKLGELDLARQAHQQCTSGIYADQANRNVTRLEKKRRRSK